MRDETGELRTYEVILKCWGAKGYINALGLRETPKETGCWWLMTERGWTRKRRGG